MAVILAVLLCMLLQVDDISAQSCVISPNITSLTIRDGLIRNVEFHCQCIAANGMMINGMWFRGISNTALSTGGSTSTTPYQINNTTHNILFINSPFTSSHAATYYCSPNNVRDNVNGDNIVLTAGSTSGSVVCTIYSPSSTTDGVLLYIPNGAQNVILYCICRIRNIAVGPTVWSHNNTALLTQVIGNNAYYRNNVPAPLIIPRFTAATHNGSYACTNPNLGVEGTIDLVSSECVISPTLTTLTIREGLVRDVELHCQCVNSSGILIFGTRWFYNGRIVPIRTTESSSGATYQTNSISRNILFINQPFTGSSHAGTYTCSPNNVLYSTTSGSDEITLNSTSAYGGSRTCAIYSTSLTSMTVTSGSITCGRIVSGATNVILYCICTINDVAVGPVTWHEGNQMVGLNGGSDNPYTRDNVPTPLIFSSFTATEAGTYQCRGDNTGTATISLSLFVIDPPTDVMATAVTPRSIMVTWSPSPSPGVTSYLISYTTDAPYISMNNRSRSFLVGNTTTGTINNVEEDTTYTITVQSNRSDGLSCNSNVKTIKTQSIAPSSPPLSVMVTSVNPASLRVSWQPPPPIDHNGAITGYMIQYTRDDGSSDPMTMEGNSGTTLSGLVAFVDYSVTVAAVNSAGTGTFSDPMVVKSGEDVPTAPRSLKVVDSNDTTVTLSWMPPDPPNGMITQYQVQYRINDGGDSFANNEVNISPSTDLTYTVTGLMTATEYRLRVRAFTVVGEGGPSNSIDIFLGFLAPTKVRATILSPRSVQITWTRSSSPGVTGYLISYTTDASYISMNNRSRSITVGNTTTGILTDLEEDTTYTITVQATASNNIMSSNSNVEIITTQTIAPSSPPQNVMVTSADPASLIVSWQPPPPINHNGPITGYVIQYTRVRSSDMMSVNVTSGSTPTVLELRVFTNYSVTVAAINAIGTGPFSDPVVNISGEDRPSAPQLLDFVSVNSSSVILQWQLPAAPNGVIMLYSLEYNSTTLIVTNTSGDVLMYTVGGLSSENVYVFQVTAHTRVGEGPPINITVVIPPRPISNVTIPYDSILPSTLILTWMDISLVNSVLIRYTVFYSPVSGPYDRIITSSRRKRQSAQPLELTMNFTSGTIGILTGLNGSVTYMIQVAAVVMLNGQVVTGDRSTATEVTTEVGIPTPPRNLNASVTNNDVRLTWSRPDPPNGLITQYSVSYVNTNPNTLDSNTTIIPGVIDGDALSFAWTGLSQGTYNFIVVASTAVGPGEAANVIQSIAIGTNCDDSSDDNCGVNIALATLLAIALIVLVVSVVINVLLIIQRKQSRYAVSQSNVRYSDVKQSGSTDHAITQSTNKHNKLSEPEYEAVDNMSDVKMDANPAYQATT